MQDVWCVTGGAGFIGSNFVRQVLAETRARVVVVDKLTYAGSLANLGDAIDDPRLKFVRADIADRPAMTRVFRKHAPTAVINFAAETHVDRSIDGPTAFVQTNVLGTFVLLQAAREHFDGLDADARSRFRFLHVSTDEVYGTLGDDGAFTEQTPYAPNSPYSATKAGADHLVRAYHHTYGLPVLVTNCSNNYGPRQFPEKLIPLTIINALAGQPLPIYGDGGHVRDWLHVDDHCSAIRRVLTDGRLGEHYNIGGNAERTTVQVVDAVCRALDVLRPAAHVSALAGRQIDSYTQLKTFVADRPGHDRRYAIDASKIARTLGWHPRHTFETGLHDTVRWYLDHEHWREAVRTRGYGGQRLGLRAVHA